MKFQTTNEWWPWQTFEAIFDVCPQKQGKNQVNFLARRVYCGVVSLDHLQSKLSRAQFWLYLKETLFPMIAVSPIHIVVFFFYGFRSIQLQETDKYMRWNYSLAIQDYIENGYALWG